MNIFRNMLYMARRFKAATVLNFIGLTVAFAACSRADDMPLLIHYREFL